MIKTIAIGSCVSLQGLFLRTLKDGRIAVRLGDRIFEGYPVDRKAA